MCFVILLTSFLFAIILNALVFIFFDSFGIRIFGVKTLLIPLHLSKLIINGQYLSSTGFKSTRVGPTMHDSPFKNRHSVAKEMLKLNNTINTCLRMLNIISYYSLSLNTCECAICQIYQQNCNPLKSHRYFHLKILLQTQYDKIHQINFQGKTELESQHFIVSFKFKDSIPINEKITIIM